MPACIDQAPRDMEISYKAARAAVETMNGLQTARCWIVTSNSVNSMNRQEAHLFAH